MIETLHGPLMVLAGPGSGKTAVLTERLWKLVRETADPNAILVITFTRAAASEMRQRFAALAGESIARQVTIATFHAVFLSILQKQSNERCTLLEEEEALHWISDYVKQSRQAAEEEALWKASFLLSQVSKYRNTGHLDEEGIQHYLHDDRDLLMEVLAFYEDKKRLEHVIDFDDMMHQLTDLFQRRPDVLHACRMRWRWFLIDEFQDINGLQYELIRKLACDSESIMAVGDEDQSIYGFRGASPSYMLRFPKDFPGTTRIDLTKSFRCGPRILSAASRLIRHNRERYNKQLSAARSFSSSVEFMEHRHAKGQAAWIGRTIREHAKEIPYHQIAVLCRTRSQFSPICKALAELNIPYRCEKEPAPLLSDMRQDLEAYLRLAGSVSDQEALARIWNRPDRHLPPLETMGSQAFRNPEREREREELLFHLHRLAGRSRTSALRYIWFRIGYRAYAMGQAEEKIMQWRDVREAFRQMLREEECEEPGVQLMTMHGSKGLEFEVVIIPDCNEGIIPHEKAAGEEGIEEERRLFYVAMTRAKRFLYLSCVKDMGIRGRKGGAHPSRFLHEIGL